MIDPVVGGLVGTGLSFASNLMTNIFNKKQNDEANQLTKQNMQWQKEQYFDQKAYNENLQKQLFEREDSSYQRTRDDLVNSGYSPLAINGTNDAGTAVQQAQVPELSSINPFQAKSMDFGQLADIFASADSRAIEREKLEVEKEKNLTEKEQKEADRAEKIRQFDETLKHLREQDNEQTRQFEKQFNLQNTESAKRIDQIDFNMNRLRELDKFERSQAKFKQAQDMLKEIGGHVVKCSPEDEAMLQEQWWQGYAKVLKENQEDMKQASFTSDSESKAGSGGVSVGVKSIFDASLNGSGSDSKAHAEKQEILARCANRLKTYVAENGYSVAY